MVIKMIMLRWIRSNDDPRYERLKCHRYCISNIFTGTKLPGVSPRLRVLGALGSAGVTSAHITYHSVLENSLGLNRLM
jgi:hypothetical protein